MSELIFILPEIYLVVTLLGIVAAEAGYHGEKVRLIKLTAVTGLAAALFQTLYFFRFGEIRAFNNTILLNGSRLFFKLLFISIGIFGFLVLHDSKEIEKNKMTEYSTLMVALVLSLSLLVSSTNIVFLSLCLQFFIMVFCFLVSLNKRSTLSVEAGIKFFFAGIFSFVFFLLGVAILLLFTQCNNLDQIKTVLLSVPLLKETALLIFALVFFVCFFFLGIFPLHFWTLDIVEGAPVELVGFLALCLKAGGVALSVLLLGALFVQDWKVLGGAPWPVILSVFSGITFLSGSVLAFRQNKIKRLVACSVVAESGFLLMGLLVLSRAGLESLLFELLVDLFSLMGVFYLLSRFSGEGIHRIQDLSQGMRNSIPAALCFLIFFVCFVGLPPFPGFISKFALIKEAFRQGWYVLSLLAICSMGFGAICFGRVALYLVKDLGQGLRGGPPGVRVYWGVIMILIVPLFLMSIFAEKVFDLLRYTVQ